MLARRFTIVCLLIALFGMLLAALVSQDKRSPRSWQIGSVVSCVSEDGYRCAPLRR